MTADEFAKFQRDLIGAELDAVQRSLADLQDAGDRELLRHAAKSVIDAGSLAIVRAAADPLEAAA